VYLSTNPVQHQRTKHVRLTCTSFVTGWLSEMFRFSMYRPPPSLLTSSPRVFLRRPSRSSGRVST
jgi:hypothetical protein